MSVLPLLNHLLVKSYKVLNRLPHYSCRKKKAFKSLLIPQFKFNLKKTCNKTITKTSFFFPNEKLLKEQRIFKNCRRMLTLQKDQKTFGFFPAGIGSATAQRKWDINPPRWPTPQNPPTIRTSSWSINPSTYSGFSLNQPPRRALGR